MAPFPIRDGDKCPFCANGHWRFVPIGFNTGYECDHCHRTYGYAPPEEKPVPSIHATHEWEVEWFLEQQGCAYFTVADSDGHVWLCTSTERGAMVGLRYPNEDENYNDPIFVNLDNLPLPWWITALDY